MLVQLRVTSSETCFLLAADGQGMTKSSNIESATADDLVSEDLYPIREVSRLTGVNPVTLRAWERRYGLLRPHRTESGHRLYSMTDVERVRSILDWIERGVAVSKVVSIIDRQPPARPVRSPDRPEVCATGSGELEDWAGRLDDALNRYDLNRLEQLHGQLCQQFPLATLMVDLWLPLLRRLQRQQGGQFAARLMFESFIISRLQRYASRTDPAQPVILMIVPEGQPSLAAAWMAGAVLANASTNLILLEAMPEYPQLLDIAGRSGCAALLLYSDRLLENELLQRTLPRAAMALDCPVGLLGDACDLQSDQVDALPMLSLGALGAQLPQRLASLLDASQPV